jgi:hypothetical protein
MGRGTVLSVLERALDELNFARNRVVHDGEVPQLDWHEAVLAYIGSRFWIVAFKRVLEWEGVRVWTEADDCEVRGLQAFALAGQTTFENAQVAYERAVRECRDEQVRANVLAHLERLQADQIQA